jgi:WhiB family redox-sensing transcriptional regulator
MISCNAPRDGGHVLAEYEGRWRCSGTCSAGEAVTVADVRRLPVPVTSIWDWQMRAACRNLDSSTFFHPENERGPAKADRDRRAKLICNACPVIESCRRHALAVHEPYGVWGGLTVSERDEVLRQGQATRPAAIGR